VNKNLIWIFVLILLALPIVSATDFTTNAIMFFNASSATNNYNAVTSANKYNSTPTGSVSSTSACGHVSKGFDFSGSNNYFTIKYFYV